jgi:hypothetical protein
MMGDRWTEYEVDRESEETFALLDYSSNSISCQRSFWKAELIAAELTLVNGALENAN